MTNALTNLFSPAAVVFWFRVVIAKIKYMHTLLLSYLFRLKVATYLIKEIDLKKKLT